MIRLQKLLAAAGLGSRRAIEEWIRAGRVSVGGRIVQLGDRATSADDVRLDGVKLDLDRARAAPPELLLYYKPVGEVTTRSDPQRSEEHTSELQSLAYLVCRLLLEKKNKT